MFFDVLACYHWLISTKHKVKLTLMGISLFCRCLAIKQRTVQMITLTWWWRNLMVMLCDHQVLMIHHLGTMNVYWRFCANPHQMCCINTKKKPITVNSKLAKVIQSHPLETRTFWEQFDGNILYSCSTSDATRSNVGVSHELWIFEPTWA